RIRSDKIRALVAIERRKIDELLALAANEPRPEVIRFSGFGSEMREAHQALYVPRLGGCTKVMLPRIYRHREIRVVLVSADPRAVQSDFHGYATMSPALGLANVLDKIDSRFSRLRLRQAMLRTVFLDVELDILVAARCGDQGWLVFVLREQSCCENH